MIVSELRYRPDIDGLRAVAVLAVVLFHAGISSISGGFVGVDVFFVISGFLITTIIVKEIRRGDFSLTVFYERRIRRILPAFFVVMLFSAVVAYSLLLPQDFENFGKSLVAASLSASNLLFWRESGYFDSMAELKPLLHTWSLGVEEQFYLFFPLLLMFIARFFKQRWTLWIVLIAFSSLLLSAWGAKHKPSATFYLLPTRAWELALGGLLAMGAIPAIHQRHWREIEALTGFLLIAWGIGTLTPESAFPGLNALYPCLGAALVIHAGSSGPSMVGHVLSWHPLVLIGLISYSLYLWHWPLLVFTKYYLIRPLTTLETSTVVASSFVAAIASWHFVERPFRKHKEKISRRAVFAGGVVATAVAVLFGSMMVLMQGVPGRLPDDVVKLVEGAKDVSARSQACMEQNKRWNEGDPLCKIGVETGPPSFIVLGDSHAGALIPGIDKAAQEHGRTGWHAAMPSCPPLDGVSNRNDETGLKCLKFRDGILKLIESTPEITSVILIARWPVYAEGTRYGTDDAGPKPVLVDQFNVGLSNREIFKLGLERTVSRLLLAKKKVYVVYSVPEIGRNVPSTSARFRLMESSADIRPTVLEFEQRNAFVKEVIQGLAAQNKVSVLYPHDLLCTGGYCSVVAEGRSLYSDDDHLSVFGAEKIRRMYAPFFLGGA